MNTENKRGHVVTLCLLLVSAAAMLIAPIWLTWNAISESNELTLQGERKVIGTLTYEELELEVENLRLRGNALINDSSKGINDYREFFAYNRRSTELEIAARILKYDKNELRVLRLESMMGAYTQNVATSFNQNFRMSPEYGETIVSQGFIDSQKQLSELHEAIARETPSGSYSFAHLAYSWALGIFFSFLFAIPAVVILLHLDTRQSFGYVIAAFGSSYKPWLAALSGPFSFITTPMLFSDGELDVDMKQVTYLLVTFMSVFVGGGVAGVKAQTAPTPAPTGKIQKAKKIRTDVFQRIEMENGAATWTTFVDVTHKDSGVFFEGISNVAATKTSGYALIGKPLFTRTEKARKTTFSVTGMFGFRFVDPQGKPGFVSSVVAARAWLKRGKFSMSIPFASLETCVTKACALSSLVITKSSMAITKRVTLSAEHLVRMTSGLKPSWSVTPLFNFKASNRVDIDAGLIFNRTGPAGFRLQGHFSF